MEYLIPVAFNIAMQSIGTFIGASAALCLYSLVKRAFKGVFK